MKRFVFCMVVAFSMFHLAVQARELVITEIRQDQWSGMIQKNQGKPFIVHFWGVSCAPCVKEMPKWSQFSQAHPDAHLVFIQVDDVSVRQVGSWLQKKQFSKSLNANSNIEMMTLKDAFDEFFWYAVDRRWHGETPMTLLVDPAGKATMKLGYVDFDQVNKFLKQ